MPGSNRGAALALWIIAAVALLMVLQGYYAYTHHQREQAMVVGTSAVILLLGGTALYLLLASRQLRAANQALGQAQSYAQHVVESISNGVISVDRQGRLISINGVACDLLGVSAAQAGGRYYYELVAQGDCRLEPTIERGERLLEKEMSCVSLSGKKVEVSVSASQLRDGEGEALGAVIVLRDLRELRDLEDQLQRSERLASMGRMVAGVAHELRNPLSSIRGFARFFQRKYRGSTEDGEYAELLVREVDRLNRVITDLLSFAQPALPQRAPVDLAEVVEHALLLCQPEIQEKAIALHRDLEAGLPRVPVDRDMLVQVLVNLIRNGVEAMDKGGELALGMRRIGEQVELSVADTGSGIGDQDRMRVFDPFFTTKQGGTGLGLAIVHSIVQGHRGQIRLESRPGAGTTFRVELPLEA
ncbi:MAG: PAS domain-containing protein [Candidatus Latescibacteria bacterium]|nr:PAS domain-containing protein [Candidatus Latescibacterota bacterium]